MIIVFKVSTESGVFISRVTEITPEGIKAKGDNNQFQDSLTVTESFLMEKVVNINNP